MKLEDVKNHKLLVIIFAILCIDFLAFSNKKNDVLLDEVKLINGNRGSMFAIKVENDEGEYEDYNGNAWPDSGYQYNATLSNCIDKQGNVLENVLSFNNGVASLRIKKTVYCYLYFDQVELPSLVLNGVTSSGMLKYKQTVSCDKDTTGTWNPLYRRMEFSNFGGYGVTCSLTSANETSQGTLKSVVEANATNESSPAVTKEKYRFNTENDYLNNTYSQFSSTSYGSTSGTNITNAFTFNSTTNEWESQTANMSNKTYYHLKFNFPKNGNFKLCYTIGTGNANNRFFVYKNNASAITGSTYIAASNSQQRTGCIDLNGALTTDYLNISIRPQNQMAQVKFHLKEYIGTKSASVGYRYQGKNPNNYIWFNDEMWRIIGEVPVCTSANCDTSENLVKIMRNESIGGLAWNQNNTNYTWTSMSMYTMLNSYYYGALDGTSQNGCKNGSNYDIVGNCDYTVIGIKPPSYYGRMIKNVYWNTGATVMTETAEGAYGDELFTQTYQGYIGLMSAADYGYSASTHTETLENYKNTAVSSLTWIFSQSNDWVINPKEEEAESNMKIDHNGGINSNYNYRTNATRPVVYLDSSVYIVAGNGTSANPYQIAM